MINNTIMKAVNNILLLGFLIGAISNSCDLASTFESNESDLTIAFSDGTLLTEKDIAFYDSSTQTYFLKLELSAEAPITDFKIKVNNDSVLGGVVHSCVLSSMPPTPYYISDCFFSGRDILNFGYYGNGESLLNDSRIINSLKKHKLLRHGLSCQIDDIEVVESENQTDVLATISITNHDDIAYYIPDVNKMGERYYTDYTGGCSFSNKATGPASFVKNANSSRQRDEIKIEDLSVLEANSTVTYTYRSRNYHAIPKGEYQVRVRFMGIVYTAADFELDQKNGRIWVGEIVACKDNVLVE